MIDHLIETVKDMNKRSFKLNGYTSISFLTMFAKGNNFWNSQFASMDEKQTLYKRRFNLIGNNVLWRKQIFSFNSSLHWNKT